MNDKLTGLFAPTQFERDELRELVNRSLEDDAPMFAGPNDVLYALVGVYTRYGLKISPSKRQHLKRMIVVHSELIAQLESSTDDILSRSLQVSMHEQLKEFKSFSRPDLQDMTTPWRIAMHDVLLYLPDREIEGEAEAQ